MPVLSLQPGRSKGLNWPFFWGPSLIATQDSRNGAVWQKHHKSNFFGGGYGFHAWFQISVTLQQELDEARPEQDFATYHFVSLFYKQLAIKPSEWYKISYDPRRLNERFN